MNPSSMRAVVLHKPEDLQVEERKVALPGPSEVLVDIERGGRERFEVVTPFVVAGPHEVDEAALDAHHRRHGRLARTDLSYIAAAFERQAALERLVDRIDAQRQRTDRRTVKE